MLDRGRYLSHKLRNATETLVLLLGMSGLLAAIGWFLGGWVGLFASLGIWGLSLALTPRLSPRIVLRLYHAAPIEPREAPGLHAATRELAARAELRAVPRLYYIPSRVVNALSLGRRDDPHIALTDGLLRTLGDRELVGVLAHEVSHVRGGDIAVMGLADGISRLTSLLSFAGQLLLVVSLPVALVTGRPVPWLAALLLIVAPVVSRLLQLALSRTREFGADLEAARLTGDPRGLASALQKMEYSGGFWRRIFWPGHAGVPSLLRTHPHTPERIHRLLSLEEYEVPAVQPVVCEGATCPVHWVVVTGAPRRHWSELWY